MKRFQEPVVQEAGYSRNGGIQGLGWFARTLLWSRDGDAAHEFIEAEQSPSSHSGRASSGDEDSNESGHVSSKGGSVGGARQAADVLASSAEGSGAGSAGVRVVGVAEGRILVDGRPR